MASHVCLRFNQPRSQIFWLIYQISSVFSTNCCSFRFDISAKPPLVLDFWLILATFFLHFLGILYGAASPKNLLSPSHSPRRSPGRRWARSQRSSIHGLGPRPEWTNARRTQRRYSGKTWENLETTELALVEIVIIRLMID